MVEKCGCRGSLVCALAAAGSDARLRCQASRTLALDGRLAFECVAVPRWCRALSVFERARVRWRGGGWCVPLRVCARCGFGGAVWSWSASLVAGTVLTRHAFSGGCFAPGKFAQRLAAPLSQDSPRLSWHAPSFCSSPCLFPFRLSVNGRRSSFPRFGSRSLQHFSEA